MSVRSGSGYDLSSRRACLPAADRPIEPYSELTGHPSLGAPERPGDAIAFAARNTVTALAASTGTRICKQLLACQVEGNRYGLLVHAEGRHAAAFPRILGIPLAPDHLARLLPLSSADQLVEPLVTPKGIEILVAARLFLELGVRRHRVPEGIE